VPIAAALISKGVSPGAALAFLMTGPATNAATILTVARVMGRKTAVIYLVTVAACAITGGLLLDFIFSQMSYSVVMESPWMLPRSVKWISALMLIAVVAGSFIRSGGEKPPAGAGKSRAILSIEGMHCEHCVESITRALTEIRGVESALVDLKGGRAVVAGNDFEIDRLTSAVEDLGYRITGVEEIVDLDNKD
jgi:copper chaperone CopZ